MQGATGLPDDLEALQHVKTLWYTTMESLLTHHKIEAHATTTSLDIITEGYAIRCIATTDRESKIINHSLTHVNLNSNSNSKQNRDELLQNYMNYSILPAHLTVMKNLALQNPAFIPTCRLVKHWYSSQLCSISISDYILEEILIYVFLQNQPLTPSRGFILFLQLVCDFAWFTSSLCVNSNDSLTETMITEAEQEIEKKRKLTSSQCIYIITPYDKTSIATSLVPDMTSWNHLISLASKTMQMIYSKWTEKDMKGIFTPNLKEFDVILTIHEELLSPIETNIKTISEKVSKRGSAYLCNEAKNIMLDRSRFLIGYEPEQRVMDVVKNEVGMGGIVMMNCEYGNKIGISWKPSYFLPMKMSMANVTNCCPIAKGKGNKKEDVVLVRTIFDIMQSIKEKLGNALAKIEFC